MAHARSTTGPLRREPVRVAVASRALGVMLCPMATHRVERQLRDVEGVLVRARRECEKFYSTWDGDARGGRYALRTPVGTIRGAYTIDDTGHAVFEIEHKPVLLPMAVIERVLDEFLSAG